VVLCQFRVFTFLSMVGRVFFVRVSQRLRLCRAIQTATRIFGVIRTAGSCHAPQDKELIFSEIEAWGGRQNAKIG
jgi:hypothetical protein